MTLIANAGEAVSGFFCIGFIVVMGGVAIYTGVKASRWRKSLNYETVFCIRGKYVTGLPNLHTPLKNLHCFVTQSDFIFAPSRDGPELARIPCSSVKSASLDDHTSIKSKVTVPRILTLGLLALAAPANVRSGDLVLLIDWTNEAGDRQNAVFEFTGGDSVRDAAYLAWNSINARISKPKSDATNDNVG
jgi:hypothetical protein